MIDGPTIEIIHKYLLSAAEEMRRTLIRTAFNPVIYEVFDFGISVYDRDLNLMADAPGLAMFLGANDYAIVKVRDYIGKENLEDGDIIIMNYPYWNSAHTADVTLAAPVFAPGEKEPFAYTCIRAHWMDLGAKDPGYVLDSTEIHQEGLIMPGFKVVKAGKPDKQIFDLIRFNSRMPKNVIGDLEAQIAATRTGHARLRAIREKFGPEMFDAAVREILDYGEKVTLRELAKLPEGTWTAEDFLDDDGIGTDPIPVRVKVTVKKDRFVVDFSECGDATRGPINVPVGLTQTLGKVALKALTGPHAPTNAGSFRPLEVVTRPGSLFHAEYPSATYTQWSAIASAELVFKALSQAIPEKLIASSGGDILGFMMVGNHHKTGRMFALSNNEGVGWGASANHDGLNATNHISSTMVRNTPVEVLEANSSMLVESMHLIEDSGGPGAHRGGLGQGRRIRFVGDGEFLSITKKSKTRPWGLDGGGEAEATGVYLFPGTDRAKRVGTYRTKVAVGDVIETRSGGGGGYGVPQTRDPALVLEDVLDGYVSEQAARDVYGVVIRDGKLDEAATKALRA